jgi:hypothetical protein
VVSASGWVDRVNSVEGYAPRRVLVLGVQSKNAKLQNELAQLLLILSIDPEAFAPANWWFALAAMAKLQPVSSDLPSYDANLVALNVFTNYFKNVAEVEVDFPKLAQRQSASAA